jgi:IS30 family transposase
MEPKRVQLSLPEKNAIPALHKAGLKGQEIARETGLPLPTIYGDLKRFKQRVTKGNKERSAGNFATKHRQWIWERNDAVKIIVIFILY